jgi:hypothetical protein
MCGSGLGDIAHLLSEKQILFYDDYQSFRDLQVSLIISTKNLRFESNLNYYFIFHKVHGKHGNLIFKI